MTKMMHQCRREKPTSASFMSIAQELHLFDQEFGRSSPNTYEYMLTAPNRKAMLSNLSSLWTKMKSDITNLLSHTKRTATTEISATPAPSSSPSTMLAANADLFQGLNQAVASNINIKIRSLELELGKDSTQVPIRYAISIFRSILIEVS